MEKYKAIGQIVKSYAGRDKGRFFVVLKSEEHFALIADGKVRKVDSPKRKKWIHLKPTKTIVRLPQSVTNKELRHILWPYNYGGKCSDSLFCEEHSKVITPDEKEV